jgi:hypothetical protein
MQFRRICWSLTSIIGQNQAFGRRTVANFFAAAQPEPKLKNQQKSDFGRKFRSNALDI